MMSSFYYWHTGNSKRRGRTTPLRASTFVPSFPETERSFWRAYGWQTVSAIFAGVVGVLAWVFYARDLAMLGSGAFMYFVLFTLAVVAGIALPVRFWRQHRMIRAFDEPEHEQKVSVSTPSAGAPSQT